MDVACDLCDKWRRVPAGVVDEDGDWFCAHAPEQLPRGCEEPQDPTLLEDEEEEEVEEEGEEDDEEDEEDAEGASYDDPEELVVDLTPEDVEGASYKQLREWVKIFSLKPNGRTKDALADALYDAIGGGGDAPRRGRAGRRRPRRRQPLRWQGKRRPPGQRPKQRQGKRRPPGRRP